LTFSLKLDKVLLNMTPQEQRIAIAEARGWKITRTRTEGAERINIESPDREERFATRFHQPGTTELWECLSELPDYIEDLNAMHEAEWAISSGEMYAEYFEMLGVVCAASIHANDPIIATAAQRAEAFLRTIGKWEDDK
jgi:hypothetical protein